MSVNLTYEQYGALMWALRSIACGHKVTAAKNLQNLSREEMLNLARDACDTAGFGYGIDFVLGPHNHAARRASQKISRSRIVTREPEQSEV